MFLFVRGYGILICLIQIETKVYFDKLTKRKHACYSYEISTQKKKFVSYFNHMCFIRGKRKICSLLSQQYCVLFARNQSINQSILLCVLNCSYVRSFPFLSFFFFDYCLTSAKQMLDE